MTGKPQASLKRKRVDRSEKVPKAKRNSTHDLPEAVTAPSGNTSTGKLSNSLIADLLAQKASRFQSDLSSVELEERFLSAKCIHDTSSWPGSRSLETIADFLKDHNADRLPIVSLNSASEQKGSPHTIVVTGAALRAVDLTRTLRVYQAKGYVIGKLFAKHIKLNEAVKFSQSTRMSVAVGTPQRIIDLITAGVPLASNLRTILVDASYQDIKRRSILDMKETFVPLLSLLNHKDLKNRYDVPGGNQIDLIFF